MRGGHGHGAESAIRHQIGTFSCRCPKIHQCRNARSRPNSSKFAPRPCTVRPEIGSQRRNRWQEAPPCGETADVRRPSGGEENDHLVAPIAAPCLRSIVKTASGPGGRHANVRYGRSVQKAPLDPSIRNPASRGIQRISTAAISLWNLALKPSQWPFFESEAGSISAVLAPTASIGFRIAWATRAGSKVPRAAQARRQPSESPPLQQPREASRAVDLRALGARPGDRPTRHSATTKHAQRERRNTPVALVAVGMVPRQ